MSEFSLDPLRETYVGTRPMTYSMYAVVRLWGGGFKVSAGQIPHQSYHGCRIRRTNPLGPDHFDAGVCHDTQPPHERSMVSTEIPNPRSPA